MAVRLFSRVKPGTAFVDAAQNSGKQPLVKQLQDKDAEDDAYDSQASVPPKPLVNMLSFAAMYATLIAMLWLALSLHAPHPSAPNGACNSPVQVLQQSAKVAVEPAYLVKQACKVKQASHAAIADVWADGSLADTEDGLPARKTRIYIPAQKSSTLRPQSQALLQHGLTLPHDSNNAATAPPKKKRKGKAERNRLKREMQARQAGEADVPA